MDTKVIAAIISFIGVIVSGLLSWYLSKVRFQGEITRINFDIQHSNAQKLQEKRIEIYPNANQLINDLITSIQTEEINFDKFKEIYNSLLKWYEINSVFMGARSNGIAYKFLRYYRRIIKSQNKGFEKRLRSPDKRKYIINYAWSLQLALKNDLGVFQVEFFDPEMKFNTYDSLSKYLQNKQIESD